MYGAIASDSYLACFFSIAAKLNHRYELYPSALKRRRISYEFGTASTAPLPMLVLPAYRQAPNVSAQATEPYLKRINANPVELHRLDNHQNLQTYADDTALTSHLSIQHYRAEDLGFVSLRPRRLSWQPVKRYIMPSRYQHGFQGMDNTTTGAHFTRRIPNHR